jgi:ectoine hydroxylase-related dioxygenase (phytanoyl-CoA dioxygenase family)
MFNKILRVFPTKKTSHPEPSEEQKFLRKKFDEDGLVVIENLFSDAEIERHLETVQKIRKDVDVKDENGFGDRIGQLHQMDHSLMSLISNNVFLREFLAYALGDEPLLFGSLNFEKGTQQKLHVDAIFFWPQPEYSMAGVWIALEDVDFENGPLIYVPGSHKWPMLRSEDVVADSPMVRAKREEARTGRIKGDELGKLVAEIGDLWTDKYYQLLDRKQAEIRKISAKRGTAVVWHSLLAHGGDNIIDKTRSRNSVVYHFLGKSALLFSFEKFMLRNREEFDCSISENINVAQFEQLSYIKYPYFVTYNAGEQMVHPL